MPNAVLERLRDERAEQLQTVDAILGQVTDRDLVDAERGILEGARERIAAIDAQVEPLAAYETLREAHRDTVASLPRGDTTVRPAAQAARGPVYESVGAFLVDYIRAGGLMDPQRQRDEHAMARVQAAYAERANQTTTDVPGLLPTPIVGGVVNLIDANRPLITSLGGARALGGIPGTSFTRPKVTQHVVVGPQTGEKVALPSRQMTIGSVVFQKKTYGGSVDVSRQSIDWTSPAAWDILVRDLADIYAVETETAVATDFQTNATGASPDVGAATEDLTLAQWTTALYQAAVNSYRAGKRMPDRIWCSLDVWASLGALVDVARVVFPTNGNNDTAAGSSSLADLRGDVLGLPRIVVPTFPNGTCIVGPSNLYEPYEDVIGLLSVIEPSILGVEVAYGGYVAFGSLEPTAFVPLNILGVLPTVAEVQDDRGDDDEGEAKTDARPKSNGGK